MMQQKQNGKTNMEESSEDMDMERSQERFPQNRSVHTQRPADPGPGAGSTGASLKGPATFT